MLAPDWQTLLSFRPWSTPVRRMALAAIPVLFLLALAVAPAGRLVLGGWTVSAWLPWADSLGLAAGTGPADWWSAWTDPYFRDRFVWSLVQAGLTALLALLVGLPIAWVLARLEFPGRAGVLRLLMVPFVVPTLVAAMGVLSLLGPQGWLQRWGGADLQGTPWLLLYGNLFFNLCVVVRSSVDGLSQVSAARLAVARTLGATPWRVFWRVEWPALLPWVASAMCLVFLYCLSGFGLALVLGGQAWATVEVEIYTLVAHELQLSQASVLAVWVMAISGVVVLVYAWLERHLAGPARFDRVPRRRATTLGQRLAVGLSLAALALICVAPLLAIVLRAVAAWQDAWQVLLDEETWRALFNTLRFSAATLLMAGVLGVLHALAAQHSVGLRASAYLPFVVSPVLVAFGLLLLYPTHAGSVWMMLAAYVLLAYPFVAKALAAALDAMPAHYLAAARTLGAGPWRVFWRVQLPLLAPALRRGLAFAGASALGEFAVTLFLGRPEWQTLTSLIYQHLGRPGAAHLNAALVLSTVLMALAMLVFLAIDAPTGSRRSTRRP